MTRQGQALAGRYELGPLAGAGGMASVYRATDRVLQQMVAVKVLGPPYDQDPAFVERFRHEARAAAALSHPNIVAIFDSGSQSDIHYIVMEYVPGQTLTATLRRHEVLEPRRAAEVGRWVCEALAAAHARGPGAPRHQARQPAGQPGGPGQGGRLRHRQSHCHAHPHRQRGAAGHGRLPVARAGPGRTVDARSDLYSLGCAVRAADGGAAVRGRQSAGGGRAAGGRGARAALPAQPAGRASAGGGGHDRAGEGARAALPDRHRDG